MLSAVFILNKDATILIEKQYREKVERSVIDEACLAIRDQSQTPPGIIPNGELTIITHHENEIWVVGVCEGDEFALFSISLLQHIGKLLATLLKEGATENSIKSEYPSVYQILDYAIDYGFPFLDESNTIFTLLTRPPTDYTKGNRLQLDLVRPWRSVGIQRSQNEILIDIIEKIDVSVSDQGRTEFCYIRGSVECYSLLSENPFCKIILLPSVHIEDVTFHRCAQVESNEAKVIPFVPPDGPFTLMKYKINNPQTNVPLWVTPRFVWGKGVVTFEIIVKVDGSIQKNLEKVEIRFGLPEGVLSPALSVPVGRAVFEGSTREVIWVIGQMNSQNPPLIFKGSASLEQGFEPRGRLPVIRASFVTIGFVASGFKIDRLEIENVNYKSFKGVKYVTEAGDYEFRTGLN
ncbi:Adaptor complexes medium subunit family protein [Histomonas meleagridis]|uniref:Adaptor complexes medium subunit family protein n=1 Tax=Histomonas meleagridis TaxID=135588 RepID=UPI003559EF9D|nr:Adaptor complexes medium subunit family protein [Histomonas meleagridis]KAH0797413.1 Adaptor complexes medium subunit family protein [Histomonas meleagridis]